METVLDALKSMGKASAREIAARMQIEPREVLEILREHEGAGDVVMLNGFWRLSGTGGQTTNPAPVVKRAEAKKASCSKSRTGASVSDFNVETVDVCSGGGDSAIAEHSGAQNLIPESIPLMETVISAKQAAKTSTSRRPERLTPETEFEKIAALLREHGTMLCSEIGKALKRDACGMVSTLRVLEKQGRIQKNGTGRKVTWSLPVVLPITEPEEPTDDPELPVAKTPEQQTTALAESEEAGAAAPVIALPQPVVEPEPVLQPAEPVQKTAESVQHETPEQTVAAVVGSIPSFTSQEETCAFSEMLTAVNREIRRTREKSERLVELREGIRHVRKHENLLQEVMAWQNW